MMVLPGEWRWGRFAGQRLGASIDARQGAVKCEGAPGKLFELGAASG